MQRYKIFDCLRVFALVTILACHFVRSVGFCSLDLAVTSSSLCCLVGYLVLHGMDQGVVHLVYIG